MQLWPEAKGLLLPHEGLASQLYVLGLPLDSLGIALTKLSDAVSDAQVVTLDDESGHSGHLTNEARSELLSRSKNDTHQILKGDWAPGKELSLWLWLDAAGGTFDAEFVFRADLLFPNPGDEAACIEAFCEIVAVAETFRAINPGSECALSASETGSPRLERDEPWTLFW